jgi:hypothetical protein
VGVSSWKAHLCAPPGKKQSTPLQQTRNFIANEGIKKGKTSHLQDILGVGRVESFQVKQPRPGQ